MYRLMHAPASVQQIISPKTACGQLYSKLNPADKVSHDRHKHPVTCRDCINYLSKEKRS